MVNRLVATVLAALACAPVAQADTLDGLPLAPTVQPVAHGPTLALRGTYVRSYFLRKTTSYALYSAKPAAGFEQLLADAGPIRMVVTVLMPRFTTEQFRSGWRSQFAQALSPQELTTFAPRIESFLLAFETLERGEQVTFDFASGQGVRISLRGEPRRVVDGDDFARALLSVWLGPRSVDAALARAMFDGSSRTAGP